VVNVVKYYNYILVVNHRELSKQVENCAMQLGGELGLSMVEIEKTIFKYSRDIFSQAFDVLKKWIVDC
jgi:hypothetical protein